MEYILNPRKYGSSGLAVHPDWDCAQLKHEFGIFNTFFNSSQLQAIGRATRRSNAASTADIPITLIQGPPGTGKTHTIVSPSLWLNFVDSNMNLNLVGVTKCCSLNTVSGIL